MEYGRQQKGRLRFGVVAVLSLFLFYSFTPIFSRTAQADTPTYAAMTPQDKAKSYVLYYAMLKCFEGVNSISNDDVIAGAVAGLNGNNSVRSWYLDKTIGDGSDGIVECGTAEKAAVSLWGYSSFDDMITDFGYKNPGNGDNWTNSNPGADIASSLRGRVFAGSNPILGADAKYLYFRGTLEAACQISNPVDYASASSSVKAAADGTGTKYVKLTEPTTDYTGTVDKIYTVGKWQDIVGLLFPPNTPSPPNSGRINCRELAKIASGSAASYAKWAVDHVDAAKAIDSSSSSGNTVKAQVTCTSDIGGVGWMICPVMNFLGKINDGMFGFLSGQFLAPKTALFSTNSGTYTAWSVFRSYANIAFVIVFLIIIYAQITGAGVSNYGIKRMLPRLIVAAILVNLSYFICQAAIDLSNLLGYGIKALFDSIPAAGGAVGDQMPAWGKVIAVILAGGAAIAGAIGLLLAISGSVLIAALLAFGVIVIILLVREVGIVLLVVLSPLAFVAYLLPNTESWFKKWYKMFSALLLVFPVVSLVFGASMLAAKIVNASAGSATGYNAILLQLTALAMAAIPLFVVPGLLKASIAATGAIGGKLQGIGNKATGRVGARARDSSYAGAYMTQRKKIKAATRAQSYGTGLRGKLSKSNISGRAGTELAATGSALASREEREAVDNEVIRLQKQDGWTEENRLGKASAEFTDAMRSGDSTRARAAQSIMLSSGNAGISQLQASMESLEGDANYSSMMSSATGQKVMSDLNGSGIKGKNAALAKLAYSGADTKVSDLASAGSTYSALTDAEVAGQSLDNIKRATQNNGITQERAVEMMNNQNIWSQLSEDKKQVIRNRAASPNRQSNPGAGTTPPATPPPTSPPQNPSSSNNPDTPLDIDHTNPTVEPSSPPTTGTVDESGRYTPPGAPDDYHDRMQQ